MNNLLQLGQNLSELRKGLGYKVTHFAKKLNLEYRTYQSYERGERRPPIEILTLLVHTFNVNLNWLVAGIGAMFIDENEDEKLKKLIDERVKEALSKNG